jgi:hypothetical protein
MAAARPPLQAAQLHEPFMAWIAHLVRGSDRDYFDCFERPGTNVGRWPSVTPLEEQETLVGIVMKNA